MSPLIRFNDTLSLNLVKRSIIIQSESIKNEIFKLRRERMNITLCRISVRDQLINLVLYFHDFEPSPCESDRWLAMPHTVILMLKGD